jgi:hypothetical protein
MIVCLLLSGFCLQEKFAGVLHVRGDFLATPLPPYGHPPVVKGTDDRAGKIAVDFSGPSPFPRNRG